MGKNDREGTINFGSILCKLLQKFLKNKKKYQKNTMAKMSIKEKNDAQ